MTNEPDNDQAQLVKRIDELCSHMWMVRTFLKHSEEHEEDEELRDVQRGLYDCLLYTSPSPRDGLLSRMPSSA